MVSQVDSVYHKLSCIQHLSQLLLSSTAGKIAFYYLTINKDRIFRRDTLKAKGFASFRDWLNSSNSVYIGYQIQVYIINKSELR